MSPPKEALWPEIAGLNFRETDTCFDVPVAIFAGRFDRQVSSELAHDYFTHISAPAKEFVWFDASAHTPPFEEPAAFNRALIDTVAKLVAAPKVPESTPGCPHS